MKKAISFYFHFFILIFLFLENTSATAQPENVFKLDSVSSFVSLGKYWKYQSGDDLQWANPEFDDSKWDTIDPKLPFSKVSDSLFKEVIWFRLPLLVDSSLVHKMLALRIIHYGASEIYIDGKLIHNFGKPSSNPQLEEKFNPKYFPISISFSNAGIHCLAVRYSNLNTFQKQEWFKGNFSGFVIEIGESDLQITNLQYYRISNTSIFISLFSFLLALSILHFFLYLHYTAQKSNLHYSLFTLCLALFFLFIYIPIISSSSHVIQCLIFLQKPFGYGAFIALLSLTHSLFHSFKSKWTWILSSAMVFAAGLLFTPFFKQGNVLFMGVSSIIFIMVIVHTIKAISQKKEGAWIIGTGILSFVSLIIIYSFFIFIMQSPYISNWGIVALVVLGILSIPISMSVYLARDFAKTNKNLQIQLIQVQELSAKTIEQEKEKKKILESQKEELEIQVAQRTHELAEKNKDILDSINYAKGIQQAIFPSKELIHQYLPESFILYKPKDIVSGDFYWFHSSSSISPNRKELIHIAAADCTGHGVPGALMSMVGSEKLFEAVAQTSSVSEILNQVNKGIKKALRQSNSDESTRDGMDVALCSVDLENRIVKYAGANRPLWLIRKGQTQVEEIKATKTAIGGLTNDEQHFDSHEIKLQQGDTFYICTDGYADQFSGQDGKKLMTKKFKEILVNIQGKTMQEQETHLDNFVENWKAGTDQVDDILVIGVRL